jgi:hypothetical protein
MTRNFPPGDIRVSDADRDVALAELSEHFQAGRLTQEEFDERSGLALRARTGNDLSELFTDLPLTTQQTPAAAQPPRYPPSASMPWQAARRRRYLPAPLFTAVMIAGLVISFLVREAGHHTGAGWLVPVLIVLVIVRIIIRRTRR